MNKNHDIATDILRTCMRVHDICVAWVGRLECLEWEANW